MRPLAAFAVLGVACVPWSTPDIGNATAANGRRYRFAKKDKRLEAWQRQVARHAKAAMAGVAATTGPVMVCLDFFKQTPVGHRHGELWVVPVEWNPDKDKFTKRGRSQPDLCNLFKGTEDAIQSVIYADDVQSCVIVSTRLYGPTDGVRARVFMIEPGDYPGQGDPVAG